MTRYPHMIKIFAGQLPPPGESAEFPAGDHFHIKIDNLLPKSEPGVDPVELATVTPIDSAPTAAPIDPPPRPTELVEFDESDPANYRFAKVRKGARYEIHAKERRAGRRIHKSLCKRQTPEPVDNATMRAVSCDQCKAILRSRGALDEEVAA